MKDRFITPLLVIVLAGCLVAVGLSGCLTSKQQVVTSTTNTTGTVSLETNTVTVVNASTLALEASALQAVTAVAVSTVAQQDPGAIPALKDAQLALGGVLNGASTNSVSQIMDALGKNGNATIASEITPLVQIVSDLEQKLLAKYGATVTGQITVALAKAVNSGFVTGLAGK